MINKHFCAGIVTYNPDLNKLKNNIYAIYNQVEELVVVDNSSKNIKEISEFLETYERKIVLIKNCENKGIAHALNQICEHAIANAYEWCITLDQDSVCPETYVENMCKLIDEKIAVAGPDICYVNNKDFFKKKNGIEKVEWIISSASVMNLNVWKKIGGFDESIFIDGVDKDYCVRVNKSGFLVIKNYNMVLEHVLGNLNCKKLFGIPIFVTHHSPLRKRYMARNSIYIRKKIKYGNPIGYITSLILKTLFFETNKITNIKAIFAGINDGLKHRMGPLQ